MTRTKLSTGSLTDRIDTLTRRKTNLEMQIADELNEGAADTDRLTRLRQETTGLQNAIRVSRTVLSQIRARSGMMS